MRTYLEECHCGSGEGANAQFDAQGIFLCYTCPKCHKKKMAGYRPEILTGYTQADVDEDIEPEPAVGGLDEEW